MRNRESMGDISKAGLGLAGAGVAVEYGRPLLKDAMENIIGGSKVGQGTFGTGTELENMGLKVLDAAQKEAPGLLAAGFAYLGLKTMFKGIEFPGKGRAA